jgi:hypothetical protein
MKWIYISVFIIIMLVLGIFNPVQTIEFLFENKGVGDAGAQAIAFIAGFTLPLTAGLTTIMLFVITGASSRYSFPTQLFGVSVILFISGFLGILFNLGLPPIYGQFPGGHPLFAFFIYVLAGYATSYGIELSICSLAISTAFAIHLERLANRRAVVTT